MEEIFLQIAPRIWVQGKETGKKVLSEFHYVNSKKELRNIVAAQALYDSFKAYKDAFDFYHMVDPNIKDPVIQDFFPKFTWHVLKAANNMSTDNFLKITKKNSKKNNERFRNIKDLDLEYILSRSKGKLDIDDETLTFLRYLTKDISNLKRTKIRAHINGENNFSRESEIYDKLKVLDKYAGENFFSEAVKSPKHLALQQYRASLYTRLENRLDGFDRTAPIHKSTTPNIVREDLLIIEDIAKEISERFPRVENIYRQKRKNGKKRKNNIKTQHYPENIAKTPHFKDMSAILEDYQILGYVFGHIVTDYVADNQDIIKEGVMEDIDSLFYDLIYDEKTENQDMKDAYLDGKIDADVGEKGVLSKVVCHLNKMSKILPREATEYCELRGEYEMNWLAHKLRLAEISQESIDSMEKELDEHEKKLEKKYGITPPKKQFIETLNVLSRIFDKKSYDDENRKFFMMIKGIREYENIGTFYSGEDVTKCLDQYKININSKKFNVYFENTIKVNNLRKRLWPQQ